MNDPIVCFLPCRMGSERVPRKNIKPFAQYEHGLVEVKLRQLLATQEIDKIVLSTNDDEILDYAAKFDTSKLILHKRSDNLSSSNTSTDELVAHARSLIEVGHILWTHVTSPFVSTKSYGEIIHAYRDALGRGYDSLMTTTKIYGFLWNEDAHPINYDRSVEKWPRTQTLAPIHEVNSAAFLAHCDIYDHENDRIGQHPYMYAMDKILAYDIDWPEDFVIAEQMIQNGIVET